MQQNPLRTSIKKATKTSNSPNYDAISQEEISNSDQFLTVIPLLNNDKTQYRRIVLLTINDTLKNAIFTMYPDGEQKTKDFSGRIMITSLSGEFMNGFRVKDGFLVSQFVLKINAAKSTATNKSASDDQPIRLNEVIIPPRKKSTIQINHIFDSSSPVYDNSTPDSLIWDFEKYGGGGGASAEAEAEPVVEEEEDFEDKIDDSELDPCTKAVLDKLKLGTVNDISTMVNRFDSGGSINNIFLKLGVTNPNNFAETSPVGNSKFDINIVLNQDYIYGTHFNSRPTNLSVATTLTHEIIHAYLVSIQNEFDTGCGTTICDFPSLFDAFIAYKSSKDPTILQDEHEELIATKYVNGIAETVQEFHTGIRVEKGMASEVYRDLALSGLYKTKYFTKTYPDDQNDVNYAARQRIIKRVHAERIGQNVGEISIVGNSCNK
ncbi:hypothetical protein [Flavobacterium sp. FPG59]|uniref:hypothetical protein n=1 Tax=Flavobacterium sp. FPG59 TaxID=1929267 RepID=UPI000A3AB4C5|nr:hypothetical protein [Flavobacterium sp. FPG59]OUD32054.1 hypothetical protein FPG59_14580 [Flavobacterium sp. FPG59]